MEDDIDFKGLWAEQKGSVPHENELFERIKKYKKTARLKLIGLNLCLLLTTVALLLMWYYFQPELWSTKIGLTLVILAMVLYSIFYNQIGPLLIKDDPVKDTTSYLNDLMRLRKKLQFLQSTALNGYYAMLSIGICLYLYEYTVKMEESMAVITYGATLLWIAFAWLYIKPKKSRKDQNKINGLIEYYKKLGEELERN